MSETLAIIINDELVLSCDRNKRLPGKQRSFLDQMDDEMQQGITLGDEFIQSPQPQQCARYIAIGLVHAIQSKNEMLQASTSAYLINRHPDLNEIIVVDKNDELTLDLRYDK